MPRDASSGLPIPENRVIKLHGVPLGNTGTRMDRGFLQVWLHPWLDLGLGRLGLVAQTLLGVVTTQLGTGSAPGSLGGSWGCWGALGRA